MKGWEFLEQPSEYQLLKNEPALLLHCDLAQLICQNIYLLRILTALTFLKTLNNTTQFTPQYKLFFGVIFLEYKSKVQIRAVVKGDLSLVLK